MPPIPTHEKERRERNLKNVLARYVRENRPAAWRAQIEASLVSVRATGAFLPAGTRWAEGVPVPRDLPAEMKPTNSHKSPAVGGAGGPAADAGTLDLPSLLARIEALEKRRYCDSAQCAGHTPDEVHPSKQFGCPRCKKVYVGDCYEHAEFTYHKDFTNCPKYAFDPTPRYGIVPSEPETIGDTGYSIPKHNAEVVTCYTCYTEDDGDRSCCDSVKEAKRVEGAEEGKGEEDGDEDGEEDGDEDGDKDGDADKDGEDGDGEDGAVEEEKCANCNKSVGDDPSRDKHGDPYCEPCYTLLKDEMIRDADEVDILCEKCEKVLGTEKDYKGEICDDCGSHFCATCIFVTNKKSTITDRNAILCEECNKE